MLAIIPARGGSKGLPGKNIKLLNNVPLIAYTIRAALESKSISKVVISTDSVEIAEISEKYGAEIPFLRPSFLAEDNSLVIDTYTYTIERLKNEQNIDIQNFTILQPTSPLRSSEDIDKAIDIFFKFNADSVVSYTEESHPIMWHKYINNDLKFEEIFSNNKLSNRQDLRKTYYPNGAIYIYKYAIIKQREYYTNNSFAYIMPKDRSVDIDTIHDFNYAEFLISKKQTNGNL